MQGVLYAAIAAAFVLGLLFVALYTRRPASDAGSSTPAVSADALAQADAIREAAEADAQATRRRAHSDADAIRAEIDELRRRADALLAKAEADAARALADARRVAREEASTASEQLFARQRDLDARSARLAEGEARLEIQAARTNSVVHDLDERRRDAEARLRELEDQARGLEARRAELDAEARKHALELERVARLSADEARAEVLAKAEVAARRDAAVLAQNIEAEARAESTDRARAIVADAVQRVASRQTTETVVSVMHLPGEEMKGRIIGREGRNIRAFESVTGVNVIIDDTPEAVLLSCFDPVRREIGRLTLDKLVLDGRIHPHRIEEAYEQSRLEVDELCLRAARDALAEVGIGAVDERMLPTIGRLKYRTSYGQNVLAHLVETAHVAGAMAAEMGIEPVLIKRCAFLHDIGKAFTHEVEGSHAIIGAEYLRRYGEAEAVAHAVEAHHNEVQPRTVEAVLTQASDSCSAARPGARRESLESYVKRLERIETIAATKPGVDRVFAMQAGREVRVMVQPGEVDDLAASVMAREIAKQIEDELTYPGQIRVTVVRESRSTEIAH
jgi:ribonuclease Y